MQLEQLGGAADRGVKRLQRFLFPELLAEEAQQEASLNTAMSELLAKGPLSRARKQLGQARLLGAPAPPFPLSELVREEERRSQALSSAAELRQATTTVGVFEIIEQSAASSSGRTHAAPPLDAAEWASFLDAEGRITDPAGFRARVYASGVFPVRRVHCRRLPPPALMLTQSAQELRKEVWKYLLGLYPMGSTAWERGAILHRLCDAYEAVKQQWTSITPQQAANNSKWRERRTQVR